MAPVRSRPPLTTGIIGLRDAPLRRSDMVKVVFLVKRREGVTHEQLIAHWEHPHIPAVVESVKPDHYRVAFFEQRDDVAYDGMAIFWFEDAERARDVRAGVEAGAVTGGDGFVELTQPPYAILECEEHVIVDGPRPEGALKLTWIGHTKDGVDPEALYKNWLDEHAPNVAQSLRATDGGLRYVISFANQGEKDPAFAGMAELYYTDAAAARAHAEAIGPDRFLEYATAAGILVGREVVGVP